MKIISSYFKCYVLFVCMPLLLCASCNEAPKSDTAEATAAVDSSGYQLVWSDEFNGSVVDTSNWAYDIGGEGWGNHEQEYYQPANATVEDGNLVITGKKENGGQKSIYLHKNENKRQAGVPVWQNRSTYKNSRGAGFVAGLLDAWCKY